SIYVYNLRGNANSKGEFRRKEAGNVFGEGTKTSVAITILVKKPLASGGKARINYADVGDYLSRKEKLQTLRSTTSVRDSRISWRILNPNSEGDWLAQRSEAFASLTSL